MSTSWPVFTLDEHYDAGVTAYASSCVSNDIPACRMRPCSDSLAVMCVQELVRRFQTTASIPLFLLTSQVGGLGLTLTAADRVIVVDPSWNPSTDNQAVDRLAARLHTSEQQGASCICPLVAFLVLAHRVAACARLCSDCDC